MSKYITFHNHDTKSLLDSCLKTEDLVKWAKSNNMKAVGVTNHGEMSSLLTLYKECIENDIKPILGEEFYVTKNELDQNGKKIRDNHHLIILAKNLNGWKNIVKLHNLSWKDNRFFYDPRITLEDLIEHKDGLIITSACIGGVIGKLWLENKIQEAEDVAKFLQNEFGEDFYLELQNHNDENLEEREKQHKYNKFLMKLSKDLGIKCIVQNDSHYYLKEHWLAHQVLLCKNVKSTLKNPKFKFGSKEYYLKNEAEMLEVFNEYPLKFIEECFKNTSEISDKIEIYDITNKNYDCPVFGEPDESYSKLVEKANLGLNKKFTKEFLNEHLEYQERLNYELETIKKVNYVDYFLMLDDLYQFTTKENIYMGIGRGSAGGSLVLYCLDVIQIDPIKYNLLFERFINVDRVSACDVDCDVNDKDRPKIISYLKKRYGENHVCNIGTYGELTAKSAFKAVATVLEIPFNKANELSGMMDSELSLEENYKQVDTFRFACQNDEVINKAYNLALILEGTYAQRGTHACGMVISSKPLDDVCPCVTVKDTSSDNRIVSTTFEMKQIDGDLKLLKLDILGLRNLGIIKDVDDMLDERYGSHPDYKNLNVEDAKTYETLSKGNTSAVFQFESALMQRIIKQVQPKNIEDLSCITAMARPSCLESGLTETFIKRRQGDEPVVPILEGTEKYMKDTLQLPLYQENCMQLSRVMAGFSGSEADTLRKYIGKKDPKKLKQEREHFVNGAINNGHTKERANEIFDIIEKFGGYGFNKSHAVGYSLLSYATAYYKTNYPIEYMCAVLNSVTNDIEKLNTYIGECYKYGITIVPPDVNVSDTKFVINENNEIVFNLEAIKGLGKSAIKQIISARKGGKFKSVKDFIQRTTKVDKGNIQALLRVGAFNNIEKHPARWDKMAEYIAEAKSSKMYQEGCDLENIIYTIIGTKNAKKSERYIELTNLKRDLGASKNDKVKKEQYTLEQNNLIEQYNKKVIQYFIQLQDYKPSDRIQFEQDLLGFNISLNPYKRWESFKKYFIPKDNNSVPYIEMNELIDNAQNYLDIDKFQTVGLISNIKELKTKKGDKMAKVTLEYFGKNITFTVFSSQWKGDIEFKIQKGNMLAVVGKIIEANKQYSKDDYELRIYNVRQLNVLVNKDNRCIIPVDNSNRNNIDFTVKSMANSELKNNYPIEKMIIYETNGKYIVLSGLNWINNIDKLSKELA